MTFNKLFIPLLLIIPTVIKGMDAPFTHENSSAGNDIAAGIIEKCIQNIPLNKDGYPQTDTIQKIYELFEKSPCLKYNRFVTRAIRDALKKKFPGMTVCDQSPFQFYYRDRHSKEYRNSSLYNYLNFSDTFVSHDTNIDSPKTQADLDRVHEIFKQHYTTLIINSTHCDEDRIPGFLRNGIIKVIRSNGNVVGFVTYTPSKPTLWSVYIEFLAVDIQHQKKGFGQRLIDYVSKLAIHDGFDWVCLEAAQKAIPFYEHLGFEQRCDGYRYYDKQLK